MEPRGRALRFRAGEGVGTVTKPGLPLPPGEPAINPVPRAMIRAAVEEAARAHGGSGDVIVEISIPGGEALAQKTLNPRLGIVGGLSILGTTGIVVPYSCAAWIHSIHRGIDVARATGLAHIAGVDGIDLRGSRAEALRSPRGRPHRHGRFRRRHAEILEDASRGARHHRRRLRQDDEARPGPARSSFEARRGRQATGSPACWRRRARRPISATARDTPTLPTRFSRTREPPEPLSAISSPRRRWRTAARVIEDTGIVLDIAVFDREGALAGRSAARPAHEPLPR